MIKGQPLPLEHIYSHYIIRFNISSANNDFDFNSLKLEDLGLLRRSPDLFDNVKIGQGFRAYNKTYFVLPFMEVAAILVK